MLLHKRRQEAGGPGEQGPRARMGSLFPQWRLKETFCRLHPPGGEPLGFPRFRDADGKRGAFRAKVSTGGKVWRHKELGCGQGSEWFWRFLGRLVRALQRRGGGQGRWERALESGLCPEGEVEPLEDFELRHDLEGSSAQFLAFRQINV